MRARGRALWLALFAVSLVVLILLAPSLEQLDFAPGHLSLLRETEEGLAADGIGNLPAAGELVSALMSMLGILVLLLLPFSLIYVLVSPEARKRVLRSLALLLWLVSAFIVLRNQPELLRQLQPETPFGAPVDDTLMPTVQFTATPPTWLVTAATVTFAILLATGMVAIAWYIWRQTQRPNPSLRILAQEAERSLGELLSGADPQDTILRCYVQMSRVAAEGLGLRRQEAMTPREFEQHLEDAGLPKRPVEALTRLFERVRYGSKLTSEYDEHEAVAALSAIVEACRSAV